MKKLNMIINKAENFSFLNSEANVLTSSTSIKKYDVVSAFGGDPFVGHLSTPITTSNLTKTYLQFLPAYQKGWTPLLRGLNIGFVHGYFLLGPFVKLGPLRNSDVQVANFVGFVSTISLLIILITGLLIYGFITYQPGVKSTQETKENKEKPTIDFLTPKGWRSFTSGFTVGGFGGASVAYVLLRFFFS
jgi:photosystem I subunit 11